MASSSAEIKQVFISYSSPAEEELKEKLVKDLKEESIEVSTSVTVCPLAFESQKAWCERKCKNSAALLILISGDYQEDDACIVDGDAATAVKCPVFFAKEKNFVENEWMRKLRGDSMIFDLSDQKYKNSVKLLISTLKQVLGKQGKYSTCFVSYENSCCGRS